jgi:transcription-repair coupling factor (superfamily II helicase)
VSPQPILIPPLAGPSGLPASIGRLIGAAASLAAVEYALRLDGPVLVLARDPRHADQLETEMRFFVAGELPIVHFVEWETLAYDSFSPHQDIISQRLSVLAALPDLGRGIVIASAPCLLQRLPPKNYVTARSLRLESGQKVDRQAFVDSLIAAGYLRVPQVEEHGELAIRGSLLDLFPMGADEPLRIDFFDDEIESLRRFDVDTQLSGTEVSEIRILPAREVPLDESDILEFRRRYRERFEGQPSRSRVYREVSEGIAHGGIEYYLPLFFDETATLLDYLPRTTVVFKPSDLGAILDQTWKEILDRYDICRLDPERPILSPEECFVGREQLAADLVQLQSVSYTSQSVADVAGSINLPARLPPALRIESRFDDAAASLLNFIAGFDGRILFTADSAGRREAIIDVLQGRDLRICRVDDWPSFLESDKRICITIAPGNWGVARYVRNRRNQRTTTVG